MLLFTPVIDILEVRSANQPAITGLALCQTLLTAVLWAPIAWFPKHQEISVLANTQYIQIQHLV
jgi:hypothetical protein